MLLIIRGQGQIHHIQIHQGSGFGGEEVHFVYINGSTIVQIYLLCGLLVGVSLMNQTPTHPPFYINIYIMEGAKEAGQD